MRIAFIAVVACICAAVLVGFRQGPEVEYVYQGTNPDRAPTTQPAASIYLEPSAGPMARWLVDSGGLIRELSEGVQGEPSRLLHHGKRWFLTTRELKGQTYSDGSPRREVFCVTEDGRAVQLTNRCDLEPAPLAARWPMHARDREISWIARHRTADGEIVEGGVYTARMALDDKGEPAGLVSQPEGPALAVGLVQDSGAPDWTSLPVPDVCNHDWSPDGGEIVIESIRQELRVANPATGKSRLLVDEPGCDPVWSPDGLVIAFKQMQTFGSIVTVDPNGGGRKTIQSASQGDFVVTHPVFAPGGERLAHTRVHRLADPNSSVADGIAAWITDLKPAGDEWVLEAPRGYVAVAWRDNGDGDGRYQP